MNIFKLATCIFLFIILGCGGGGGGAPEPAGTIFVDSVKGDDLIGDGEQIPFRTLTRAIVSIGGATQIKLAAGTYDSASGEVFPIFVPAGVTIRSDTIDFASNRFALVRGTGPLSSKTLAVSKQVTFVLDEGSTVQSVVIEGPGGVGIWNESGRNRSAHVENCVIRGSNIGVVSAGTSSLVIERSVIQNNVAVGIDTLNEASPVLKQTNIKENGIGILVSGSANPSFGGEQGGDSNELRGNTFCDLRNLGSAAIQAQGVFWDDDPFTFTVVGSCSGGANIVNESSGSVSFQFIPPVGVPIFVGAHRLTLINPSRGAILSSNQPEFSWIPGVSARTILVIWDRPPSFVEGELGNKSAIQWLWHSGLGTGLFGDVTFEDGRTMPFGDINNLAGPQPLQRGKTYYWAVWEWDEDALSVQASSELGYFTVLN